jgi:hypothetical protein
MRQSLGFGEGVFQKNQTSNKIRIILGSSTLDYDDTPISLRPTASFSPFTKV